MKQATSAAPKAPQPKVVYRSGEEWVGLDVRLFTFFGILALGMLLCLNGAFAFHLYPAGLIFILAGLREDIAYTKAGLLLGYFLYLALLIATITLPLKKHFRFLVIVMMVFMLMNVAGCQIILHEISAMGQ
ncbi:MAG TPA: hypothetical protein P5169_00975 [Kiritimatiellia bacterium]|nr:hypothetical protein [Kiritimatiellia bacterium]